MDSARQGHLQLPRADAIRSRLIDTFSLIEHLQGLSQAVPRHTLREILDPSRQKKLMLGDQHQLVRFSIKPRRIGRISYSQRMLNRLHVRCSERPPLCLWAGWVLENPFFANFITFLIMLNTLVLMVEIELLESTNTKLWPLKLTLEVAAWFILFMFILEILLMWLYNFFLFWKNSWNVFDFVITVLSLLPEIVAMAGISGNSVWLQMLRICRVLRSLKLIARFRQIRVIILALVRALKSMTFLLMLLLIFFYIFAVTGVYFFEDYTRSTVEDLEYNLFFSDLLNSLVTVFILFTLDHWYAILQDIWKVPESSRVFSSIYVILWLLLGSIIFRNIIVAMMVTNFQNIRNELSEEMTQLEVQYKADVFKQQIILRRQNLSPEAVKSYHSKMDDREGSEEKASEDESEACESSADEQGADEQGVDQQSADEQGAAGPRAAGPSAAGPSTAGQSAAGQSAAGPSVAGPSSAGQSAAGPSAAGPSSAGQGAAGPSAAGQSAAGQSTAEPSAAEPSAAEEVTKSPSKTKEYPTSSSTSSSTSFSSSSSKSDSIDKLDWETLVHENLPGLMDMDQDDRVVWPRDSLFRYFELLEKLQYNLEERKKLQEFAEKEREWAHQSLQQLQMKLQTAGTDEL